MSGTGKLQSDPLFLGLTRAPMLFGVSYLMVALNGLLNMLYMINTSDIIGFFFSVVICHGMFYIVCFYEPLLIQLLLVRGSKCSKCRNRWFHGRVNSYEAY